MKNLDLNKIKQESIHTGLLEAMITLRFAYEQINATRNDPEFQDWQKIESKLSGISDALCEFTNDISDLISIVFCIKADESIDRQTGLFNK